MKVEAAANVEKGRENYKIEHFSSKFLHSIILTAWVCKYDVLHCES